MTCYLKWPRQILGMRILSTLWLQDTYRQEKTRRGLFMKVVSTYGIHPISFGYAQMGCWEDVYQWKCQMGMQIIQKCHTSPYGGHYGVFRTHAKIWQSGFFLQWSLTWLHFNFYSSIEDDVAPWSHQRVPHWRHGEAVPPSGPTSMMWRCGPTNGMAANTWRCGPRLTSVLPLPFNFCKNNPI